MYQDLGRGLVELLWCAGACESTRDAAVREVKIDGLRDLEEALDRGPVVLLASHTGNWELAAAAAARWLRQRGRALHVVAKPMSARGVDEFVARLREGFGLRTISPRGALAAARRALAVGDVVVMPIDQVPDRGSHGTSLPFLGAAALVDRAPATLALRAAATVLVVAAERDADDAHRVHVLATIAPPGPATSARAGAWIGATTMRATSVLDDFVRSRPHAWLWLHRRWRSPVPAPSVGASVARATCRVPADGVVARP